MISFDNALAYVLENEGGWSNDPTDAGGCTNYGLTLHDCLLFPEYGIHSCEDLKHIKLDVVKKIYYQLYWRFGLVNNQQVATKIFDIVVNLGLTGGSRVVQRAVNQCNVFVAVDGQWGVQTERAVNRVASEKLLPSLVANLKAYYRKIADNHPAQEKFLDGWLVRAERLPSV